MYTGIALFQSIDVHQTLPQVNLIPAQTNQFADTQTMTIGQHDQRRIAMPIAAQLLRQWK
jgi:hypothetical protein